jgi:hypothetical protein
MKRVDAQSGENIISKSLRFQLNPDWPVIGPSIIIRSEIEGGDKRRLN